IENEEGRKLRFRIVGYDEIFDRKDYISIDSPMARALLKKEVDDEAQVTTEAGTTAWDINPIEYEKSGTRAPARRQALSRGRAPRRSPGALVPAVRGRAGARLSQLLPGAPSPLPPAQQPHRTLIDHCPCAQRSRQADQQGAGAGDQ